MLNKSKNSNSLLTLIRSAIVVFVFVISVAGFALLNTIVDSENERFVEAERSEVTQYAFGLRADIEQALNQKLFLISGLRSFVAANDYVVDEDSFQEFASTLAEDNEGVRSIQLAPAGIVTNVYPLAGNEAAIGHDLLVDDERRASVYEAIENNRYIVTGPINLLQGGTALIARQPIYLPVTASSTNQGNQYSLEHFWGFATVLIDVDSIYKVIEETPVENEYNIVLRGKDGTGSSGEVFYGDENTLTNNPVYGEIVLPVGSWQIAVTPEQSWTGVSPVSVWLWSIGIVALITLLGLSALVLFSLNKVDPTKTVSRKSSHLTELVVSVTFFALIIALSVFVSNLIAEEFEDDARYEFSLRAITNLDSIQSRFGIYINVLEGGKGLFSASESVERDEWKAYVDSLAIQENYPGIQGLGYAIFVTPEEKVEHEVGIQAEGFPEFTIRPTGERDVYTSIIYLEPFDERNKQAFGFDMFQETNRNQAMSEARDTGNVIISNKITLVQEIDDDVQAGFLLYAPQYKNNASTDSLDDRRENIVGYVYSPFRAGDFIEGIIGEEGISDVSLSVYDGTEINDQALLFSDETEGGSSIERFNDSFVIEVGGKPWTLVFKSTPDFGVTAITKIIPIGIIVIGVLMSIIFTVLLYVLFSSRRRAAAIAESMTISYLAQQQRLRSFNTIVTMPNLSTEERISKTLGIVANELGLDIGIVSQIRGDEYTIKYVSAPESVKLVPGDVFPLGNTYCETTFKSDKVLKIGNASESEYVEHPCRKEFKLESYIGLAVVVNGHRYGTVNFSSAKSRPEFTDDDEVFVSLAARWISRMIENKKIDESKDEFLSLASHQLRTPLSIINWYSEILQDKKTGTLTKKQREYVAEISEGGHRMTSLVNTLLNTSRLDLGTFKVEPEEVNVKKFFATLKKQYAEVIKSKKIKYTNKFDPNLEVLKVDETILTLIVDNFLSNAVKYTPEKGSVSVSVELENKKYYSITIKDTGYGIPEKQQHMMFSKMFRAENVMSEDTDGTGLGLYMVQLIIQSLKGTIEFKSKEGKGSTFVITLPVDMKKKEGTSRLS